MFCVIQKVINKKNDPYGGHKELLVDSYNYGFIGDRKKKYNYKYSEERFERPIKDAYKIIIHESFRANGKVLKRQWVICTMSHYNLLDTWVGDHIHSKTLKEKLAEMDITEDHLWDMVCKKLDPIIASVKKEFESTEEYRTKKKHEEILAKHRKAKTEFEEMHGADTYEYCYDIFGRLKNKEQLRILGEQYQAQQDHKKSSGYYKEKQSNYGSTEDFFKQFSGYFENKQGNYNDEEKGMLKTIYRALSKSFHPDITKDDGEMMKFVNRLKEGWGI